MSTDTKVTDLIINKGLTKAELNEKYQQGLIGDNELSIVDTEESVVQVDEMPVASASNVGSIVQFSGETTEDYTNGYFYKCILNDGVYSWIQTNVQPGGGGAGTEWKTIVDLPATYSAGAYLACPQFIVQGGLPDGNYEFYYQVKTISNSGDYTAPFGVATYKIVGRIFHDNGQPYMFGSIAPIIDGGWMPSVNYIIKEESLRGCFYEDSGNFIIWGSGFPFVSDIGDLPNTFVPECFKLSAIKNTDTGDEYIATGIEPDGQQHYFPQQYSGILQMGLIQADQTLPSYFNTFAAPYGRRWLLFSGTYITVDEYFPSRCSECDISLISSSGGKWHIIAENTPDSYKITLLEASGDLANVQIGYNESSTTILYINTPSGTTGTVKGRIGIKGSTWADVHTVEIGQPDNFTQFVVNTVGGDISTNNYGSILQYTGVTDSNYTNGYFYKASGTQTMAPASMLCNETSGLGLTITCNDVEGFVTALASYIGWDRTEVQNVLKHQVTIWEYTQSSNRLNWSYYGDVDSNLISYFDIVGPEVPASTVIQWTTSNYVAEGIVITNPHWDRVDVQPAADPLPTQTGNAGKFLTTDGTDASWTNTFTSPLIISDSGWTKGIKFQIVNGYVCTGFGLADSNTDFMGVDWNRTAFVCSLSGGTIGTADGKWDTVYTTKINNGADITVPDVAGKMAVQVSLLPTAASTNEGEIYQFVGTTDSSYTNGHFYKCVSDGQDPATYSWEEVQLGSGGGSSYTAGTGISIDANNEISAADPVLMNKSNKPENNNLVLQPRYNNTYNNSNNVFIMSGAGDGFYLLNTSSNNTFIGAGSNAATNTIITNSIAIGYQAKSVSNAIQLGMGTNDTPNTFKVSLGTNNNFELMSADGTIPTARLTKVNTTITLTAAGWSSNTQTVNVTGMTATGVVFVSPDPTDQADYTSSGILCTSQATDSLEFTCTNTPTSDIDVVVVML